MADPIEDDDVIEAGETGPAGATGPEAKETDEGQTGSVAQTGAVESGPKAKPSPPEKYEIKLPDGSLLDAADLDKTVAFAKERGLSNEEAQALLDQKNDLLQSYAEKQKTSLTEASKNWLETSQSDKEIGGKDFKKNAEVAKRVIERFGTDELKKGLVETGFGNHPELVRLMVRIGKSMTDDQLELPGSTDTAERKDMADIFYGSKNNDNKE